MFQIHYLELRGIHKEEGDLIEITKMKCLPKIGKMARVTIKVGQDDQDGKKEDQDGKKKHEQDDKRMTKMSITRMAKNMTKVTKRMTKMTRTIPALMPHAASFTVIVS